MPNPSWERDIVLPSDAEMEDLPVNEAAEKMDRVLDMLKREALLDLNDDSQHHRIRYAEENKADNSMELRGLFSGGRDGESKAGYHGTDEEKKTLYGMVLKGSLFVYPLGEASPRQVQIGEDGRPRLSPPIDGIMDFDLQPPRKPGLLKSFLHAITFGFAFRDEFAAYERGKSAYERARKIEQALPAERHRREAEVPEERPQLEERKAKDAARKELNEVEKQIGDLDKSRQRLDSLMGPKCAHVQELLDGRVYQEHEMPLSPVEHTGGLTDHEFAASALGACASLNIGGKHKLVPGATKEGRAAESYDFIFEGFFSVSPRPTSGQYGVVMDQGRKAVEHAAKAMEAGDYGPMGKLIADGLKMNNDLFASSQKLNGNAAILGEVGGTLLGILEGRPELMAAAKEGGLTEQDLQNARGAAAMAQVYRNGLEAQKEIHQAVLEGREVDRPEARAAAVFGMEMVNRSVALNYTRHEKTIESSREEVQIKQILVDKELYDLRAANAAPEMIAQKEAENVRLRLESAAFAYRGFPASDMQKQLGTLTEKVTDLQTQMEKLPDVRKLAQKRPAEIGKIMRSGGIGKILNSVVPQKRTEPEKRPTEPELQKTEPQKTGPKL